ncbi:MAG: hypothetical protein WDN04_25590 [Rhodospirillales bacterium]
MKAETEATLARALIHRHGMQAAAVAREHVEQSQAQGDREAAVGWAGVARVVNELRAEQRAA